MKFSRSIKCVLRLDKIKADGHIPIYFALRVGPTPTRIPTGKSILLKDWNVKENTPKKTTKQGQLLATLLNKKMSDWETYMLQTESLGKPITFNVGVDYFKENTKVTFYSFCEQMIASWESTMSPNTIKSYKSTLKIIKEFKPRLDFGDIDLRFLNALDTHLRVDRNNSTNGCWVKMKNLRALVNASIKHEYMPDKNPFRHFKLKTTPGTRCFLSIAEVKLLMQPEPYEATKMEQLVRSVFIFGIVTGLRYSDLMNLKLENIKANPDRIEITMQKTKKLITIPLNSFAMEIIKTYTKNAIKAPSSNVFPYVANQVMNRNIKQIGKAYGLKKELTMHVSRHTYASNMVEANINMSTIMQLMGHQKISDTQIYAKALASSLYESVDKLDNLYGHVG